VLTLRFDVNHLNVLLAWNNALIPLRGRAVHLNRHTSTRLLFLWQSLGLASLERLLLLGLSLGLGVSESQLIECALHLSGDLLERGLLGRRGLLLLECLDEDVEAAL